MIAYEEKEEKNVAHFQPHEFGGHNEIGASL